MKRIIALIFAILFMFSVLTACDVDAAGNNNSVEFKRIQNSWGYDIYCDTETRVMYIVIEENEGCAMCPLYNADGTLRQYRGE